MDDNWIKKVLKASERLTPEQEQEFVNLVSEVSGKCSLEVARALMKTFSDKPDYGTQERVNSVLATADRSIVIQALLEELPRLIKEAPEWANSLVAQEVNFRIKSVEDVALKMPKNVQNILKEILRNDEVVAFNMEVKKLRDKLAIG